MRPVMAMNDASMIRGHDLMSLERFRDDTRHMIVFDVLTDTPEYGEYGDRKRLFLSDQEYEKALEAQQRHRIKIRKHAAVIEGHIVPDKKKKRRGH